MVKEAFCQRAFALPWQRDFPLGADEGRAVVVCAEDIAAHVVGDDEVEVFARAFGAGVGEQVFGFGGEAHGVGACLGRQCGDGRDHVRILHEGEGERGVALFFLFLCGGVFDAVVGNGGSGEVDVARVGESGGKQVCGAFDIDAGHARRGWQCGRAADEGDSSATARGGGSQRVAHFAAAVVGEVAHRVNGFARRSGGDGEVDALPVPLGCEPVTQGFGFGQAARADVAAGLCAAVAGDDGVLLAGGKGGEVCLHGGVGEHVAVHRRREVDVCVCREVEGGEEVVGDAVREFAEDVRGGGGDEVGIRPACQFDVPHALFGGGVKEVVPHCFAGDGLQGGRADEVGGVGGVDDADVIPLFFQEADEVRDFVSGDAAADADEDVLRHIMLPFF